MWIAVHASDLLAVASAAQIGVKMHPEIMI